MFFLDLRRNEIVEDFIKKMPKNFQVLRQMRVSFKNERGIDSGAPPNYVLSAALHAGNIFYVAIMKNNYCLYTAFC